MLLNARYEHTEKGSVRSRAVQIALRIDGEGRRQVLAPEVANRESEVSTEFLSHEGTWPAGSRVCGLGQS